MVYVGCNLIIFCAFCGIFQYSPWFIKYRFTRLQEFLWITGACVGCHWQQGRFEEKGLTLLDCYISATFLLLCSAVNLQSCILLHMQRAVFSVEWCAQEPGKRSQLWRMSSTGMLQHEGSSAPQDPHKSMSSSAASLKSSSSVTYVLDIKDIALQPDREVPLTLRKPEERRRSTQIWQFKVCRSNTAVLCLIAVLEGRG